MIPSLIFLTFVWLLWTGFLVARRYGPIPPYIGFAWLFPVTSLCWLAAGIDQSLIRIPFALTVIAASFVLSVICFPMILHTNREPLSVLIVVGYH